MPADVLQHALVTLVALYAAWVIVRRVTGLFRPGATPPRCASCSTAQAPAQPLPLLRRPPAATPAQRR